MERNSTFALIIHVWKAMYVELSNSSKFAANLNKKGICFFLLTLYALRNFEAKVTYVRKYAYLSY